MLDVLVDDIIIVLVAAAELLIEGFLYGLVCVLTCVDGEVLRIDGEVLRSHTDVLRCGLEIFLRLAVLQRRVGSLRGVLHL